METKPTSDVDLVEVIKESLLISGARINRFSIEKDFPSSAKLTCYRARVGQVITNLLVNAADALTEKVNDNQGKSKPKFEGVVRIKCTASERDGNRGYTVKISDNGYGVPMALKKKIFDQFFTSKEAGKGTGLGLSLSAEIIDEHGGNIEIKDDPELGGALFEVWLPSIRLNGESNHEVA